jgi:hypothetical protein
MGINARIYLNPHTNATHVHEVCQKVVGVNFNIKTFSKGGIDSIDLKKPSSKENSWYLKPGKESQGNIELSDVNYFNLNFKDVADNSYSCLFHFNVEDDEYSFNNEKLMGPPSTPVWCAIGKRLIDFFGGKMLYSDAVDFDELKNWYFCETPKFPSKTKGQSGDDRWYQYYNLLKNEPLLTHKEIIDMKDKTSYWNERDSSLSDYLSKYEFAVSLSDSLISNKSIKKRSKKLKV